MHLKKIVENEELNLWISELNKSFKNRSSANIPYKEVKSKDIVIDNNNVILGIYNDANKLLGGASLSYCMEYNNVKTAKVGHVWTMTSYQKQGIGSFLMKEVEDIALQNGSELLQLNVANIYLPAVHLYKKSGFKNLMIYANVPQTYYFIRMIKAIGNYKFPEGKRIYILIKSIIIFKILFKRDSSPTFVNKKIYTRLKASN